MIVRSFSKQPVNVVKKLSSSGTCRLESGYNVILRMGITVKQQREQAQQQNAKTDETRKVYETILFSIHFHFLSHAAKVRKKFRPRHRYDWI